MEKQVILKTFGTGQITLPKEWRDTYNITYVRANIKGKKIELSPLESDDNQIDDTDEESGYTTVFNAKEFGYPKGIPTKLFLQALREVKKETKNKSYGRNKKISKKTS